MQYLRQAAPRSAKTHAVWRGLSRSFSRRSPFLRISEEVEQALAEKRPVVALESTIYTHGFPYPDNVALASFLESVVRTNGGIPATIGILDGIARVGLDAEELIRLAGSAGKPETLKISRRDLGFACGLGSPGRRLNGGTTIAGTMILAHLAGIKVFATGGLGGVHRGAESSMDISADLTELGRTPVAVISSGCKSFLDIPRTLEYLETEGVPVATFADGRTANIDFPAFWSRDSGLKSPMVLQDEAEAAAVIYAQHSLGVQTGMLFGNPIPEEFSIPREDIDHAIHTAIKEAEAAGATGSANTPFILAKIKELTKSTSVTANRALIESNVRRGTLVAKELLRLEIQNERETDSHHRQPPPRHLSQTIIGPGAANYNSSGTSRGLPNIRPAGTTTPHSRVKKSNTENRPRIFVAGALAVDLSCDYVGQPGAAKDPALFTSNPASISQSLGGVAHNVARAAHLLGGQVRLCSAVGDDLSGKAAIEALASEGMQTDGITIRHGASTAQYIAVNDSKKDLFIAVADMGILEDTDLSVSGIPSNALVKEVFDKVWLPQLQATSPSHVVLDANWQPEMLALWLKAAKSMSAHVSFEPVSNIKSTGLLTLPADSALSAFPSNLVDLVSPNSYELAAMHAAAGSQGLFDRQDWWEVIDALGIPSTGARTQLAMATSPTLVDAGVPQQSLQLLPFIPCVVAKLGAQGVLVTQLLRADDVRLTSGQYSPYILSRCNNGTEGSLGVGGVYMRLFPAAEKVADDAIVSVNGVGDTFLGALIAGLERKGKDARVEDLVDLAQRAAVLTLKSNQSVSPGLTSMRPML